MLAAMTANEHVKDRDEKKKISFPLRIEEDLERSSIPFCEDWPLLDKDAPRSLEKPPQSGSLLPGVQEKVPQLGHLLPGA